CGAFYMLTGLGVTVGFHRHFTHGSFRCRRWVRGCLAVAGSMAAQGPVIYWVAVHRRHHKASDSEGDPHSPHGHRAGVRGILRGFCPGHVGWMFQPQPNQYLRYAPDLMRDGLVLQASRWYLGWVALGLALPALVGAALTRSLFGAATALLWGGLVRI